MRLSKLSLNLEALVSYPVTHDVAEQHWIRANESGAIPEALFRFYCRADYFSLEKAPPFLSDAEPILFPYLANLARGIKDCLVEAAALIDELRDTGARTYDPIKRQGESWDPDAPEREVRALKLFLVDVSGSLDSFAEMVALEVSCRTTGNFYTARMTSLNGPDGTFYTFLPKRWPFMLEQHLAPANEEQKSGAPSGEEVLRHGIVHVDLNEYVYCTLRRVLAVLDAGFSVLCDAYSILRSLPTNRTAIEALDRARRRYAFEYYPECEEPAKTYKLKQRAGLWSGRTKEEDARDGRGN